MLLPGAGQASVPCAGRARASDRSGPLRPRSPPRMPSGALRPRAQGTDRGNIVISTISYLAPESRGQTPNGPTPSNRGRAVRSSTALSAPAQNQRGRRRRPSHRAVWHLGVDRRRLDLLVAHRAPLARGTTPLCDGTCRTGPDLRRYDSLRSRRRSNRPLVGGGSPLAAGVVHRFAHRCEIFWNGPKVQFP